MAFIKWRKCFSSPNQFLKLIIVIGCICFSVYQVVKCVEKLIQPPISTYYGFHLNDTIRYPSVTICRSPSFNTALFPKFGLGRINDLMTYNAFRHFNFVNYTIKDFLEETTWPFDEVISSFAYNGLGNPYKNTSVVEFYSITRGRCFTLTPRSTSERFSISGGWWFYLKHNFTIRSLDGYGMSTAGFHIHLHDDNEIMTSETDQENNFLEYIYLEAAEDMRLTLKIQEFKKVSTTDLPCIDNDSRYSKSRCQELCVHRQIAERLNCTLPWLWMIRENRTRLAQCSNSSSVHALLASFGENNRKNLVRNCNCPMTCHVNIYTPSIISRKEVEERLYPYSFIAIYYTTNLVTYMHETIGYSFNAFIADIGGSLGFLLGLSVIGFIAVLEKTLRTLIKTYFNNKQKLAEEEQSQVENGINNQKIPNRNNKMQTNTHSRRNNIDLYDNLRDFDSDDFKYYQKTLIVDSRY